MNIFVASLNFKTTQESLQQAFEAYGQVTSARIVKDRVSGRSKGFGFVEMPNEDDALRAIAALNESELDGRALVVKKANPAPESRGSNPPGGESSQQ